MVAFGASTLLSYVLFIYAMQPSTALQYLFSGPGLGHLGAYLLMTTLGALGYGALFLLMGIFLKNPLVPALIFWVWQWLTTFMPPMLKRLSIIHYLKSVNPVPVPDGPFAILSEPTPAWLAVLGLLLLAAFTIAVSGWKVRRLEITYSAD